MVMMPARSLLIWNFMARIPVTAPASAPAMKASGVASMGCQPFSSSTAVIAAPRVIDPSAVMSGKSKM